MSQRLRRFPERVSLRLWRCTVSLLCWLPFTVYRRTGASAAQALAELQRFAAQLPRAQPLPPSLPMDAPRVLAGQKRLLAPTDALQFACTGCGACCRAYAPAVLLDSRDIALLAPRLPPSSASGDVSELHPAHFSRRVGSFPLAALPQPPQLGGTLLGLPLARPAGTAPILFLRSQGQGKASRCSFAAAGAAGAAAAAPAVTPPPASPRQGSRRRRSSSSSSSSSSLRCTLGKEAMPLACALYPLGTFLPSQQQPALPELYSEDDETSCEGLGAAGRSAGAVPVSAEAYLARGGLPPRLASASWWAALATAWACSGIEEDVAGLGPDALPPAAWLAPAQGSAAAPPRGGGAALPSPFLLALRSRVRGIWYSPTRPWVEGETEGAIEHETRALYSMARAHATHLTAAQARSI